MAFSRSNLLKLMNVPRGHLNRTHSFSIWSSTIKNKSPPLQPLTSRYMATVTSFYDALEVTPKATQTQIKAAYYRLSKMYHPDISESPDAKAKFSTISEAYEVLGNIKARRLYDRGMINPSGRGRGAETEGADYSSKIRKGAFGPRGGTVHTGHTDVYDFDEFYRQHYGSKIGQTKHYKQMDQEGFDKLRYKRQVTSFYGIICAFFLFAVISGMFTTEEESKHLRRYRESREENET